VSHVGHALQKLAECSPGMCINGSFPNEESRPHTPSVPFNPVRDISVWAPLVCPIEIINKISLRLVFLRFSPWPLRLGVGCILFPAMKGPFSLV
jgi:hypothetical protein